MGTIEKSDGLTADGMSLVREQIEKVFTVALLAEDPCKWREAYLKDGWVRLYKEWLYEKEETANLPRFVESANKNEALLERLRLGLGITEAEKEFVEHKFYYPEQSLPAHLAGSKIDAFPSPKMASEKVSPARRGYLNRWHIEYVYFCGFSHVLMDKQIVMQMQRDTSLQAIEPRANLLEVHAGRGLMGSYMAGACAAADVYTLTGDIELMVELSSFWTRMTKVSLTAISLWEQGIKQILPAQVDAID